MSSLMPGDILILTTRMNKSRKWHTRELTVVSVHKGKSFSFVTVSNGMYMDTIDLWALKCSINANRAKIKIRHAE
jgi:hypothetical protein